jgi:hypothetical protein
MVFVLVLVVEFKVYQNIVAFDVVVSYIVRVDDLEASKNLFIDRQVQRKVLCNRRLLLKSPIFYGSCILFHDDVVAAVVYTIVVKIRDTWFKPKLLKAGDLSEDVMQDTTVLDRLRQVHLLDSYCLWLPQVGLALVNYTIGSFS